MNRRRPHPWTVAKAAIPFLSDDLDSTELRHREASEFSKPAAARPRTRTPRPSRLQSAPEPTTRTVGPRLAAEPFPGSPRPPTTKARHRGRPHKPQFGAGEPNISAGGWRHCLQGRPWRRREGEKNLDRRGQWPSLRPPATARSAPARGDGQLSHAGRRRRSPGSMAVWPTATSERNQRSIDLTTCFSSEDGWRGACASRRRDRRLRLLQALVRDDGRSPTTSGSGQPVFFT